MTGERIEFQGRKIGQPTRENSGVVHRGPDTPQVPTGGLNKLAVLIPGSRNLSVPEDNFMMEAEEIQELFRTQKGHRVIPVTRRPLTQFFYTSTGGGRVGGGGMSTEALRRAKRKARQTVR
ncbi:hypothetical protein HYS94_00270 [Candidatus Daviesbacteria bacterium]|nr:hypothetical protein [Candidatus Daviesbacteria bacterium]